VNNTDLLANVATLNSQIKDDSITVSQLNRLAKSLLENNMPICWISGEISGVKRYSHIYFDLKDEGAKVSCVMFAGNLANLDFTLENGAKVELRGKVTIYPTQGSYQIDVERIRKLGIGDLWEAYNRLLEKLKSEGLFEARHKKPLSQFPRSIGIITSKEGSVIRDVITTLKRRIPNIPLIIYHSAVQGQDAAMQIAKAIDTANKRNEVEVLIVCRGGGSLEDLWCFNEEVVARHVFQSNIPIISAVGHETDTTIIDFVADLRAPTPTAAAELVAKSKQEWQAQLDKLHTGLTHRLGYIVNDKIQLIDLYSSKLRALNPLNQLKEKQLKVLNLAHSLQAAITARLHAKLIKLNSLSSRVINNKPQLAHYASQIEHLLYKLQLSYKNLIKEQSTRLTNLANHLELVNPYNVISRGYAIVRNKAGQVVLGNKDIKQHERITIMLKQGVISAIVDKNHDGKQDELI
jgi:exodeoxyribonuclease VII large subunit